MKKIGTLITGVNLIAALVVINMILSFYPFFRIDLTRNQLHSLSTVTKETIQKLDDVVSVKVFMTQEMPPEVKPIASSLKTILDEMARINPGRLKVTYRDPNKDATAKTEAEKLGIQPLQFSNIKSDKFEVQSGYFGLAMVYGKKQIVLPVANDVGNLEYFVISGLKKLTSSKTPKVALADETVAGSGQGNIQYLRKFLERNYTVVDAILDGDTKLPGDADSLVIVGRTKKIDDKGITKISDWVKSGKGLIGYISQIQVGQDMRAYKNDPTGLEGIFKNYGMEMEPKLIWDPNGTVANFQSQSGAFLTQYPYWPQIVSANINSSMPINSGINSLMTPWASPIKISGEVKTIFTSGSGSAIDDSFTNLSPVDSKTPNGDTGKQTIGAMNTNKVKIALIADPQMIEDQFVANSQQNLLLGLNLVDYFSSDSSLMKIRGKSLEISMLAPVGDQAKSLIRVTNMGIPIIILFVSALAFGYVRKRNGQRWSEPNEKTVK